MVGNNRFSCLLRVLGFVLLISVVLCDENSSRGDNFNGVNAVSKDDEEIINATRRGIAKTMILLTFNFHYLLTLDDLKRDNIIFAPVSIVKTLATILLGTADETEIELARILGWIPYKDVTPDLNTRHQILGLMLTEMTKHPRRKIGANLHIAGAVFAQKGYQIKPKYAKLARSIYDTEVIALDFAANRTEATDRIDKWINYQTFGRIKESFTDPVPASATVLPVGCLYFNGNWEYPFSENLSNRQPFYLGSKGRASGEEVTVKMMVNTATVPYYEDRSLGFRSIGLPYKGKDTYMYILLPKLNNNLTRFVLELAFKNIQDVVTKSKEMEITYVIPKMVLSTRINLKNVIGKLLYSDSYSLFDPLKANFSNLAEGTYVDDIVHRVEIDINEVGRVPAATTAITFTRGAVNLFRVNRPFLFFIYNVKVDTIIFWGSIGKPVPNNENS